MFFFFFTQIVLAPALVKEEFILCMISSLFQKWNVVNKLFFSKQVGQVHGGLMGVVQRAMERSCPHIWFERAEMRDRHLVTQR